MEAQHNGERPRFTPSGPRFDSKIPEKKIPEKNVDVAQVNQQRCCLKQWTAEAIMLIEFIQYSGQWQAGNTKNERLIND